MVTAAEPPRYVLVVMARTGVSTVALPPRGAVTLGRGEDCDVRIDDPRLSRRHAEIRVEGEVRVIDLGSRNGTLVRGERIEPERPVVLEVGSLISLGNSAALLEDASALGGETASTVSLLDFQARCEVEHARARRTGGDVAVIRVACDLARPIGYAATTATDTELLGYARRVRTFEVALRSCAGADAIAAVDGAGVFHVLLPGRPVRDAQAVADAIVQRAHALQIACTPRVDILSGTDAPRPPAATPSIPAGKAMQELMPLLDRVCAADINVLLLGETGVGKEIMARTIHERSTRSAGPLLCLNCAALSENLLESELFGHEKGAFTGATQTKEGLLESARGGTVFLDEIGEMPLGLQAKLLRVLEQREVLRVGAVRPRPIHVRFIAATNRDLQAESEAGRFRRDLFFRLNTFTLQIPALRDRRDEIEALACQFIRSASQEHGHAPSTLSGEVLELFMRYPWPGNIRELKNVIERAVLLAGPDAITVEHLPAPEMLRAIAPAAHTSPGGAAEGLAPPVTTQRRVADELRDLERKRMVEALEASGGVQKRAAALIGMPLRTFRMKSKQYGIDRRN